MKLPKGKTVRMKAADAVTFLAALRSGKYTQTRYTLYRDREAPNVSQPAGYCCLGVLQHCLTGGTEEGASLPSRVWLGSNGIEFYDADGEIERCPWLPSIGMHATNANDMYALTFDEIADAFEKAIVTY